ncbi:hypothetical protein COP1_003376 [Malus domestica]
MGSNVRVIMRALTNREIWSMDENVDQKMKGHVCFSAMKFVVKLNRQLPFLMACMHALWISKRFACIRVSLLSRLRFSRFADWSLGLNCSSLCLFHHPTSTSLLPSLFQCFPMAQLKASSSKSPRASPNLNSVPWINPFPRPQPGQQFIVVERPRSVVTLERGCTRVSTSLYYTANVEHMESRCLVRKMFGQAVEAKLIQGIFKEEPRVFSTSVMNVTPWNEEMQEDVVIYFPHATLFGDDLVDPGQGYAGGAIPGSEAVGAGHGKDINNYPGHNWEVIADLDNDPHGEMFRREDKIADEEDNLWVDSLFLDPPFRSWLETDKLDNDLDDILIDKHDVMLIETTGSMVRPSRMAVEMKTNAE